MNHEKCRALSQNPTGGLNQYQDQGLHLQGITPPLVPNLVTPSTARTVVRTTVILGGGQAWTHNTHANNSEVHSPSPYAVQAMHQSHPP